MSSEVLYPLAGKRVWVAGHRGMVGSAIVRRLASEDCDIVVATRAEVDLRSPDPVRAFVETHRPDAIFLTAGKVGGVLANQSFPADFLYDNLMIAANVAEAAYRGGVGKMLMLGSSALYPKDAPNPIREEALLTGPLDPTHQWYATAKIAGVKLAQAYRQQHGCDFISALPTNMYGSGASFDPESSHVLPALIRKAHEARLAGADHMVIWGSGAPRRELLSADDCADACVFLMQRYSDAEPVNIGTGEDMAIIDLARLVCDVVGFSGDIVTDTTRPDGIMRRLMSGEKLKTMGWAPTTDLRDGIAAAYAAFKGL